MAVSLYDIIQLSRAGWQDGEIVSVIEATDARFVLEAATLVELKESGVSDRVIEVLLERSAAADRHETVAGEEAAESGEGGGEHPHESSPSVEPEEARRPCEDGCGFSEFRWQEPGASHGAHQHWAVGIEGVPVLILRAQGDHGRVRDRAGEVVARLSSLRLAAEGRFLVRAGGPPVIVYLASPGEPAVEVLAVTPGDVVAYQRRSLGEVSAARLAAYWAAALNDYTRLLLLGGPPLDLTRLHLGATLERVYERLSSPDPAGGNSSAHTIAAVLDHLSAEDKEHLIELASRVPAEFETP